ncbi:MULTISPECIES: helix-turn-helix transcriptional regulator [Vibrio]|uniref:Helix-turn-helix domain-containing protein n=1 Tax=Vibrio algicola TaxID=2662262 RepID=A0A5Q0TGT2_9VIBR|nr:MULTISPECIES: AraC family transcriptional regulator [Vibrio]MBD1577829.1 AraC family transcriptional regulator [Vibrio sp. S11_S32]
MAEFDINAEPKTAQVLTLPSYMERHQHGYPQIVIGLKGRAEFEVDGEVKLIGPGQGCIVPAGYDHRFGGIGLSDILVLNFFMEMEAVDSDLNERVNALLEKDIYFQLDLPIQQLVQLLVKEIQADPDDVWLCQACQDTIIALLHRHTKPFEMLKKGNRLNIDLIDRYIQQHLASKISVANLAACVFLGESHFHLLFKSQVGCTPHQYIVQKRIELAQSLIKEGQYNLGHISQLVGFSDQSTFTNNFCRLVGVSPSHYRKNLS